MQTEGRLGLGILDNRQGLFEVGRFIDIEVADAGARLDAGDFGLLHAGADESGTSARNEEVNEAHGGHQFQGARAGGIFHPVDAGFGEAHSAQAFAEGGHDGACGAEGFLATAQHADVATLQGEGCGIGGDIGATLKDDGDDAHGDRPLFNAQAIGAHGGAKVAPHRIGQRSHLTHALGHSRDAGFGEGKTIEHHFGDGAAGGFDILRIRRKNGRLRLHQGFGHGIEGIVAKRLGGACQEGFGGLGRAEKFLCGDHRDCLRKRVPTLFPSRMA